MKLTNEVMVPKLGPVSLLSNDNLSTFIACIMSCFRSNGVV